MKCVIFSVELCLGNCWLPSKVCGIVEPLTCILFLQITRCKKFIKVFCHERNYTLVAQWIVWLVTICKPLGHSNQVCTCQATHHIIPPPHMTITLLHSSIKGRLTRFIDVLIHICMSSRVLNYHMASKAVIWTVCSRQQQ